MAMYLGDKPVKAIARSNNLIDFTTPFANSYSVQKPFSIAEGTYTMQAICEDYEGTIANTVDVAIYDENSNKIKSLLGITNGGTYGVANSVNSWATFSITAEEAARTRYISVYMNGQTGADLIGKRIKLMLNYGKEVLPYEPYNQLFTAPIKKCVGRNLIDFTTPFANPNTVRKPFSIAEGTYTLQVICDDYDGPKTNTVDVAIYDENSNKIKSLLGITNGGTYGVANSVNSWATFSITAEEAARTRYISVYMNGQTGADLIGKRIKLMLNYGTEVLPYEPYTEWYEY